MARRDMMASVTAFLNCLMKTNILHMTKEYRQTVDKTYCTSVAGIWSLTSLRDTWAEWQTEGRCALLSLWSWTPCTISPWWILKDKYNISQSVNGLFWHTTIPCYGSLGCTCEELCVQHVHGFIVPWILTLQINCV